MQAADWREQLAVAGYAVVRGVALDGNNRALRTLAAKLGTTSAGGVSIAPNQPNVEADGISRVEAMDLPRRDPAGREILSTTAGVFPLHTDDTFVARPARYVLMHCWKADAAGGGVSQLAHVSDILSRLAAQSSAALREAAFASPFGPAPVLWDDAASATPCIRFNHRDFASFGERYGPALSADQVRVLDEVLVAARACAVEVRLAAGDCLVVDNHRMLHGRTAFDPGSGRLLKRLRVS
jgi:gamma-butyrobetaine dioxygenase